MPQNCLETWLVLWSPVPALLQMSHGEFFTASQSLGRQSRKPYYIWGQAPLKLTATAATAKLTERKERARERERGGMFAISTWQQGKLHTTWSHLLGFVQRQKEWWALLLKMKWIIQIMPAAASSLLRMTASSLLFWKRCFVVPDALARSQKSEHGTVHCCFTFIKPDTFPDVPPYSKTF